MPDAPDTDISVFSPEDPGPPADWKPDWSRWQRMITGGRTLVQERNAARARVTELETALTAEKAAHATTKTTGEQALTELRTAHATEIGTLRGRVEETEFRAIPGLDEPDIGLFRAQHQAAVASLEEAKRPGLVEWTKTQAAAWAEKPEEAPRWARGFLAASGAEPPPVTPEKQEDRKPSAPKPPTDATRRPPPPPRGGYTSEQVEAMSPAEYAAHKDQIEAQLRGAAK